MTEKRTQGKIACPKRYGAPCTYVLFSRSEKNTKLEISRNNLCVARTKRTCYYKCKINIEWNKTDFSVVSCQLFMIAKNFAFSLRTSFQSAQSNLENFWSDFAVLSRLEHFPESQFPFQRYPFTFSKSLNRTETSIKTI